MGNQAMDFDPIAKAMDQNLSQQMSLSSEPWNVPTIFGKPTFIEPEPAIPSDEFDALDAMARAKFPKRFLRSNWVTPEFVKSYAPPAARDGFRDFRGLFIIGPTGRKKTASLCLMARDWLMQMGRKASKAWGFVSFPELCVDLQASWSEGGEGPKKIIDYLAEYPLLIIDDIGAEKTTDFVLQSAYLILNKRELNELPTYGTSNLTLDQISRKLDERIASRIRGMCHVVTVGGEDQRGK